MTAEIREARLRRHRRVRQKVAGTKERPRLSVFRSLNHIYAQIIDDRERETLAAASTVDEEVRSQANGKKKAEKARLVGSLVAKRARDAGITEVVLDRGGYQYHGRVKALADGAREAGLKF